MKKNVFFVIFALFLINLSFLTSAAVSNDDYAVEVVLNKPDTSYNIKNLIKQENLKIINNKYVIPSSYNQKLAAIIYEDYESGYGNSASLSVRLQLPTKNADIILPYLKIISTPPKSNLNMTEETFYNGWNIQCTTGQCTLEKQRTQISITKIAEDRSEIIIETEDNLIPQSQGGVKCFSKFGNSICVNSKFKVSVEEILKHVGAISSFNDLFVSYNIISIGNRQINTLTPDTDLEPDWKEAMRQELVSLKIKNIISITNQDIEEIVSLTEQGKAGVNSRIIYDINKEKYDYYYKTSLPISTENSNRNPFSFTLTGNVITNTISDPYYLVPIIITLVLFTLFILLIITAKIITRTKRKKKIKPITGLLAQQ